MSSIYVIMKEAYSPAYLTEPTVHGYFTGSLKEVKGFVADLESRATINSYWWVKAKHLNSVE